MDSNLNDDLRQFVSNLAKASYLDAAQTAANLVDHARLLNRRIVADQAPRGACGHQEHNRSGLVPGKTAHRTCFKAPDHAGAHAFGSWVLD